MSDAIHLSQLSSSAVETPIGILNFYPTHAGGEINNILLKQGAIKPYLPTGMAVIECIAVLLEFSVTKTVAAFDFCGDWESLQEKGYGNNGEWLDAWEWPTGAHLVMVGTEDRERLNSRISLMPCEPSNYPITMQDNKMRIRLHNLPAGNYSLHYIVAWNDYPETHESSCWYAVDVPHEKVKEHFNQRA